MNVMRRIAIVVFVGGLGACAACGASSTAPAESPAASSMKPEEARAYLAEVRAQRGGKPIEHLPVMSMEELVTILMNDDVTRFEEAVRYVEGRPGVDALTVHATLELAWSDAFSTIASLAEEFGKRARIDEERLRKRQATQPSLFSDADRRALHEAKEEAATLAKAYAAAAVLSQEHLRRANVPVGEALRQYEKDPRAYRVAAFYHLLNSDWPSYDKAMTWFEGHGSDAGIQYIRAMESLKRYGVRKDAREHLEKALQINPKLVRAQAKLVLVEENIDEMNAELQRLQSMAPSHIVVNIAGPTIKREYAFSTSLARAREAESSLPPK
jgi:hypothetical protein